jgi:2-aminoadipate transaminase
MQVLEPYYASVVTVPTDFQSGIEVDGLQEQLADGLRPALVYAMADGHNPLGVSVSASKRRRLAEIVRQYRLPLVEDDAYGLLHYDGKSEPPVSSLQPDSMFYVGSFSKILGPALRVGWVVAPKQFIRTLSTLKEAADINAASLSQRIICECLDLMDLDVHISSLIGEYRQRRDAMVNAIRQYFPSGTTCTVPRSGFFAWAALDINIDTVDLCKRALEEERIAFIPGSSFAVGDNKKAKRCLRLNFSNCRTDKIEDGIRRLGAVINRMLEGNKTHRE